MHLGRRLLLHMEALEPRLVLTAFAVNTTVDEVDANPGDGEALTSGGDTSLRAAIMEANALSGEDSVEVPAGTFSLSIAGTGEDAAVTGDLDITETLFIVGAGANQTFIDAADLDRVFHILPGVSLDISGVTIRNGATTGLGGGILNEGSLTISDSAISQNAADTAGGGIANNGAATTLHVVRTTISENSTPVGSGDGGGIVNLSGTVTIGNSTFSGNSAADSGAGIRNNTGPVTITNSTITDNSGVIGGGIFSAFGGTVTAKNSLIAGNTATISPDLGGTTYVSDGNNLIGIGTSGFADDVNGDQVGTSGSPLDPQITALEDHGGPTRTHALLSGSSAIDAGNNTGAAATDQRGLARIVDGDNDATATVDIGAFEFRAGYVVSSTADAADANPGDGVAAAANGLTTLRSAIMEANALAGADTITLPAGTYALTVAGANEDAAASGDLDITDDLTIVGSGANTTMIDASDLDRVLQVLPGVTVSISQVTITNGSGVPLGGGILNEGDLTITDSAVSQNVADSAGGGFYNNGAGATLTVIRSTISDNAAPVGSGDGGGVANVDATLIIANSTLSGNSAADSGGGIRNNAGPVTLDHSTITNNSAAGSFGGGVFSRFSGMVTVTNTIIAGNTAALSGPDIGELDGSNFNTGGHNLIGDRGSVTTFVDGVDGDQVGTAANPMDPKLGALLDNGGPTRTHALLVGSPAIDAGDNTGAPATDQRGLARIVDGDEDTVAVIDIGAYELEPAEFQSMTFQFTIDGQNSVPFELFSVITTGTIQAEVDWTGNSEDLTASLTGRRRPELPDPTTPYAQVAGTSPLTLTYDVTEQDLDRGVGWRLIINDESGAGDAQGTIQLTVPFDEELNETFEREKIELRSGEFWPTAERQEAFLEELTDPATEDGLHGLISLSAACSCFQARQLEQLGLVRQTFLPRRHAFGFVRKDIDLNHPAFTDVLRGLTPLEPEDKIDPHILVGNYEHFFIPQANQNTVLNPDGSLSLTVQFADDVSTARIESILNGEAISFDSTTDHLWSITLAPANLTTLAAHDEVEWIESGRKPHLLENNITRGAININPVHNATINAGNNTITYAGLTGNGITVGVDDDGIDGTHPDLNVVNGSTSGGTHGTHVAGIIAASGVQSALNDAFGNPNGGVNFQWRGMAPNAGLIDSGDLIDADNLLDAIQDNSLDVSNHSHAISPDGDYDSDNRTVDQEIRGGAVADGTTVPRRPQVYSAGNGGNGAQFGNQQGYFSLTKQVKNALVVGNWNVGLGGGNLAAGSSMGPTHDGRIKPDLVAPGTGITSTGTTGDGVCYNANNNNGYGPCSGTSMAAPVVSGLLAVLLEGWQNTYSTPLGATLDEAAPLPSTLRALLIDTATDIVGVNIRNMANADVDSDSNMANGNDGLGQPAATVGPDFATGWGMPNAQAAVNLLQDFRTVNDIPVPNRIIQDSIAQGRFIEYDFVVDNPGQVQVTLAWDDIEAASQNPATNQMLVNDLDLELVAPDDTIFYPWQLGQTITDLDGNVLANNAQPPGTSIQVQIPISPTNDPGNNNDYVPANALTGNGAWVAGTGKDHLNNVEQVSIAANQTGHWKARVLGFDVHGAQDFSLVGFPYPDLADLVGTAIAKAPITALSEDITFSWRASNVGAVGTGASFDYQVYLSTDFTVDAQDVALTDANQSVLGPLAAGASADQLSTVQITQNDVDTLLGAGSTLEDLLDEDVFILVQIDSADQILEHNETNTVAVQLARLVDVALVMDRSGSMGAMVPVSNGNREKLDLLKDSVNLFLDLMRKDDGDRLTEVSFSGVGDQTTDFALAELTTTNVTTAKSAVDALDWTALTDIRGGLQWGLDELLSGVGGDDRRRIMVLFSDGMWTQGVDPREPAFLQMFDDNDVRVFSVGFGTEGGGGSAGIDIDLLNDLQNVGPGGFYQVTSNSLELDKFFVNALAGAVDSQVVVDPVADIATGGIHEVDMNVSGQAFQVRFVLTWDNPAMNLNLALRTPSGRLIDAGNAGLFGQGVTLVSRPGDAYKIFEVTLPITGPIDDHAGRWQMVISNPGSQTVQYSASAIVESTVRVDVPTPQPGSGTLFVPGDPILLQSDVRGMGRSPISGAGNTITPTVPLVSLGDILSSGAVSPAQLAGVPTHINSEPLSQRERIVIALRQQFGGNPLPRGTLSPFPLTEDLQNAGLYNGSYVNTNIDGTYHFLIRTEGLAQDCSVFHREVPETVVVTPVVDIDTTDITVTTPDPGDPGDGDITVTVTPVGTLGGLFGAGLAPEVQINVDPTLTPTTSLTDNLDGSYSQSFTVADAGVADIQVQAMGTDLPSFQIDPGVPAPTAVTPAGGVNDVARTLVVAVDPAADLTSVTGVNLVDGNDRIALTNVGINQGNNTVSAEVPAGADPGLYFVHLVSGGIEGPTAATATYRVVGVDQDFPDYVNALTTSASGILSAADENAGIMQLGRTLRELRMAPTGMNLTNDAKLQAVSELLQLISQGQGVVSQGDIRTVLSASNQTKIDARFIPVAPVQTPAGVDTQVDLGNGVVMTFGQTTDAGQTMVAVTEGPPEVVPSRRADPFTTYELTTTAQFDPSQSIEIEFTYQEGDFPNELQLRVFHLEGNDWVDRTSALDTTANTIKAQVDSLSDFIIVAGQEEIVLLGDMDRDNDVDFDDIDEFVLGLSDPSGYDDVFGVPATLHGDADQDGDLDFDDIDDFVTILNMPLLAAELEALAEEIVQGENPPAVQTGSTTTMPASTDPFAAVGGFASVGADQAAHGSTSRTNLSSNDGTDDRSAIIRAELPAATARGTGGGAGFDPARRIRWTSHATQPAERFAAAASIWAEEIDWWNPFDRD